MISRNDSKEFLTRVLKMQQHVLECAEEHATTKGVQNHIKKIRSIDVDDLLRTNFLNDPDFSIKLIKYFKLIIDKKYQMHIINKCSSDLIDENIKSLDLFVPLLEEMKSEGEKFMKNMNTRPDKPLTKQMKHYLYTLSNQLTGFRDSYAEYLHCASKNAKSKDVIDVVSNIKILYNKISKQVNTLNSSKTMNDMFYNSYNVTIMLIDMMKLTISKTYMDHIYKNCQKEIYKSNVANGKRNIMLISMIAKQIKRYTK